VNESFPAIYFSVWIALVIGSWLFFRRLDPKAKKVWQPRIGLFNLAVIGLFFLGPMLLSQNWLSVAVLIVFFAFFIYFGVYMTRVCESCGSATQPQSLFTAAEFCSKCGAKLTATRLMSREV
jgi:hypothetical protein